MPKSRKLESGKDRKEIENRLETACWEKRSLDADDDPQITQITQFLSSHRALRDPKASTRQDVQDFTGWIHKSLKRIFGESLATKISSLNFRHLLLSKDALMFSHQVTRSAGFLSDSNRPFFYADSVP
jgi:AraC-like DNA-binding protein